MTAPLRLRWTRVAPDRRQLVVDCRHRSTRLDVTGPAPFSDAELVALAVAMQEAEPICRCTREGARA